MALDSKILNFTNDILSKIQDKADLFVQKSYILSNIDNILFLFVCLSLMVSITASNAYTAPILCCIGILYLLTLLLKKGAKIELNQSLLYLLLYFFLNTASTINSTMPYASMIGLSKTILYLIYFCGILQYLRLHKEKIPVVAAVVGLFVSFEVVVAFLQNSFDVMSAATWQDTSRLNPELVLTRVYGTLKPSNPNLLGGYLIAAAPFLWMYTALSFVENKKIRFITGAIFSAAVIPAIFMTGCRGAYIALFIMICTTLYFAYKIMEIHYPKTFAVINVHKNAIIIWLCGLTVAIMVCVPKISHRILSIFAMRNDSSTSFRMNVYQSSIQMFQDNILLGIGCGNKVFREIYGLYMRSGFDALSAYSIFLETAVEGGIFALIFYICFIGFLLFNGISSFLKSKELKKQIVLVFGIISIIGVLVHGFVDTVYFRPQIQLIFWLSAAVVLINSKEEEIEINN
ncbi:MAG: O-antigen ligase family protein [Candidatus Gastranaerophilaceae bacterium]